MMFRNRFKYLFRLFAAAILALTGVSLQAAGAVHAGTIGISIPLSGDASEIGQRFRVGAKLAMEKLGSGHQLFIADDGCDADLGILAAESLETAKANILIGMICNAPTKVIVGHFSGTNIPAIVTGARSIRLIKDREREDWNLWRLSPGDDYPVEIAAQSIRKRWSSTPYAIVDDGTIYGRSFTDMLRAKMDELGLKPQFSDTFRAAQSTQAGLLRRLQRSGVTAAFIASTSVEDLFTISKNLSDFAIDLEIITTEALEVLPYLEEAKKIPSEIRIVMAPAPKHDALEALLAEREIESDRQVYNGYAAIQVAIKALEINSNDPTAALAGTEFETVLGPIRFSGDGSSNFNPYDTFMWNGETLAPEDAVVETQ